VLITLLGYMRGCNVLETVCALRLQDCVYKTRAGHILSYPNMSRAQRIPDEFQEGTHTKCRGRTVNTGKSYQPHPSHSLLYQQPVPVPEPPSVPLRHHGEQNDIGLESDYLMHLDPTLPTEEEVRRSYGRVLNPTLLMLFRAH